jgi:fibronectin type 3 domain-containing protein
MKRLIAILFLLVPLALAAQGPPLPYSVALSWTAPSPAPTTGYNVYRAPYTSGACGTYALLNTAAVTVTTYSDTTVVAGAQYCYEVTALDGTAESGPDVLASNPVSLPPSPPTGLTATVK